MPGLEEVRDGRDGESGDGGVLLLGIVDLVLADLTGRWWLISKRADGG